MNLRGIQFAQQLKLRVPSIKRVVRKDRDVYIIMTRIHGRTMEVAWPTMTWLSTIYVAFQLRHYVGVMRSRNSPTAGSLVAGKCNSIWLDDYYGLPEHATPETFSSFIQFWLQYVASPKADQRTDEPILVNVTNYRQHRNISCLPIKILHFETSFLMNKIIYGSSTGSVPVGIPYTSSTPACKIQIFIWSAWEINYDGGSSV